MKTDSQNKADASAKRNIRLPPLVGPYVFSVHFHDGPHNVGSLFPKPTCRVKISIDATSSTLQTVTSLINAGAGRI